MDIREKYNSYRKEAKDGDILLWNGNSLMAKLIRFFDDNYVDNEGNKVKDPAYYTHSSLVYWGRGQRLLNADSWYNGITVVPASHRIDVYRDFCVLRPKMDHLKPEQVLAQMDHALNSALKKWDANIPYDYFTTLRVAIIKKTGIDITGLGKRSKFICSEYTQRFTLELGIQDYFRGENAIFTPQDHLRFEQGSFELLFDDKLIQTK